MNWPKRTSESVQVDRSKVLENRSAFIDISDSSSQCLKFGEETLFINASIMDENYKPRNAPWRIDLELPLLEKHSGRAHRP